MSKKLVLSDDSLSRLEKDFSSLMVDAKKLRLNLSIARSYITDTIEIWIRKTNNDILLEIEVDDSDNTLIIKRHRTEELTKKFKGKKVTRYWIENFLKNWGEDFFEIKILKFIEKTKNETAINTENNAIYYVYRHKFKDGSVYIGKGKHTRYLETKIGRSIKYLDHLEINGEPVKEVLAHHLTEDQAYAIENELIILYREHNFPILNITDGFEKVDFGDLPWRTLMTEEYDEDNLKEEYRKILHLSKKTNHEETYLIGFTVVNAAKKIGCSCNDVIKLINSPKGVLLNDFEILSSEDASICFPNYKLNIKNQEEINFSYENFKYMKK